MKTYDGLFPAKPLAPVSTQLGLFHEAHLADKIDTSYIMEQFRHIERDGIIFVCTKDEREEDDWTDEDGRHIVIRLPYKVVKQLSDARPMMLARVKERLRKVA